MSEPGRLRLREVRQVFRLIGEIRELGADPDRWRPHMARAGRRPIGASIVVSSEVHFRKNAHTGAAYEIVEHEAALVAELFRRYADDGASIAELARWLSEQGVPTRTGKHRWDRRVIWGMLRNPAYAGRAAFGKTMVVRVPRAQEREVVV